MNAVRSYREVAQALKLSVSEVKAIEFRAMKKCRELLLKDCPDDFEDVREIVQTNEHERKSGDDAGV